MDTEPMVDVPLVDLPRVFHVGTLDPARRGKGARRLGSREGACLSVSLCPNAWTAIARLGGEAWWELGNGAGRFVDAHALTDDAEAFGAVVGWGLRAAMVEWRDAWRCWRHDDETGTWGYMTLDTRAEAVDELGDEDDVADAGPGGGPAVEPFRTLLALPALEREIGGNGGASAEDLLVMAWARPRCRRPAARCSPRPRPAGSHGPSRPGTSTTTTCWRQCPTRPRRRPRRDAGPAGTQSMSLAVRLRSASPAW